MARLWQSGFELNSTTAGVEWTTVTGSTIQTSTTRTGTYAGQVSGLVTLTAQGFAYQFISAASAGPLFFRFYLNIATLPTAANRICSLNNTTGLTGTSEASLKLDNTGALTLFNGVTQVGSASSALSLNTWYAVEIQFNSTGGVGAGVLEARLNQSVFATASNLTIAASILEFVIGGNLLVEAQTTGSWFFDDIAINNNSGTNQTSYPGSGKIVHYHPNGVGDSTQFTKGGSAPAATNWQGVNEVTPDDGVTFNAGNTTGISDMFTITSDSTIGSSDTINLVAIGVRNDRAGIGAPAFNTQIESQSGGIVMQSSVVSASAAFITNNLVPLGYTIVSYVDPQAGGSWTKSLINTSQIGYKIPSAGSNNVNITNVWISIDFTPGAGTVSLLSILGAG